MGKVALWIGGVFLPFGLVFAGIGGWFIWSDLSLASAGGRASGTVIAIDSYRDSDGDTMHRPVVEFFDTKGTRHQFSSAMSSSSPDYEQGETVDVIYDPDAPGQAKIDSFFERFLFPGIFGLFGAVFAGVGAGFLIGFIRRKQTIAQLLRNGIPIQAEFQQCYRDTSTKVNGRSPYRVVAQGLHPTTGKLATYKSEPIWLDLSDQLTDGHVKVLVDPQHPKKHYVDLSEWVDRDQYA